jgi:crossover junction endodeoxyribonuclease RuvC
MQSVAENGAMAGFNLGNISTGSIAQSTLGIDPGLNRTGYALIRRSADRPLLIEGGVIRSRPSRPLSERVHEIGQGVRELIEEFQPEAVAIERVFSLPKNPKSALLLAHARGAILFAIASAKCQAISYSPRQMKKLLTGSGTASKLQVQEAIRRELALTSLLEPNDVADACAMALCHYYSVRFGDCTGQVDAIRA